MANLQEAQIKAAMVVWFEAVHTQWTRLSAHFQNPDGSRKGKFDTVFLLEGMRASLRWIDEARALSLIPTAALPVDAFKSTIIELRNMNAHQNEYVFGKGRRQSQFEADTEFKHHADSVVVDQGFIWVGGRLNLNDAYLAFAETRNLLLAHNFWPPNQAPSFS